MYRQGWVVFQLNVFKIHFVFYIFWNKKKTQNFKINYKTNSKIFTIEFWPRMSTYSKWKTSIFKGNNVFEIQD